MVDLIFSINIFINRKEEEKILEIKNSQEKYGKKGIE
jgi:hypothetical protein